MSGRKEEFTEQLNDHAALRLQCQTGALQDQTVLNINVTPNDDTVSTNDISPIARSIVDHSSGESILIDKQRVRIGKKLAGRSKT